MSAPASPAHTSTRCLTDAEIAGLRNVAPGAVPEAAARHLASCERCQARALFGAERPPAGARRPAPAAPSVGRTLLLAALVLAAMAAFYWTLLKAAGRIQ
jgi:hypothetical protein